MTHPAARVDLTEAQRLAAQYKNITENAWLTKHDDTMVHRMAGMFPALIGELTEARQQLETAQQRANELEAERDALGVWTQTNINARIAAEQAIQRVKDLCVAQVRKVDYAMTTEPNLPIRRILAALGAAVNDSSTEATQ